MDVGNISIIAILFLTLYAGFAVLDQISVQAGFYSPLFAGAITGIVLGDLATGLTVGATLQLMTLGVATYGGASIPDYLSGSIIGTAFAIISGQGAEYGIGLAVPIGLLLTQLDVLGRMTNTIFQNRAYKAAEKGDYKTVETSNILGILPWTLTRMIPVFLGLFFGTPVVEAINTYIPQWLMIGLRTVGGMLPALGLAILMRYLPIKKFFPFFIIGFVIMAFAGSMFSILAVSLIGLAMAFIVVGLTPKNVATQPAGASAIDDEEVEIDG